MAYGPAPESDKQALEWIARHDGTFGLFIGGGWTNGKSGELFDVINPATTARLARVTQASEADADAAVASASLACVTRASRAVVAGLITSNSSPLLPLVQPPPMNRPKVPSCRAIHSSACLSLSGAGP